MGDETIGSSISVKESMGQMTDASLREVLEPIAQRPDFSITLRDIGRVAAMAMEVDLGSVKKEGRNRAEAWSNDKMLGARGLEEATALKSMEPGENPVIAFEYYLTRAAEAHRSSEVEMPGAPNIGQIYKEDAKLELVRASVAARLVMEKLTA